LRLDAERVASRASAEQAWPERMKTLETELPGVIVVEPRVFGDSRGFFFEALHTARYRDYGIDLRPSAESTKTGGGPPGSGPIGAGRSTGKPAFAADGRIAHGPGPVQINHSRSVRGTLRGLHFQNPHAQGKLVWVVAGTVFDVAVDVRRGSPTFGRWTGVELSAESHRQIWVPPGFAHGFCVLTDSADCLYACTDYYAADCEHTILWSDPDLAIRWPVTDPVLSEKDARAPRLRDATGLPSYRT
jgi:dTDP-4-dehydrorhamnose 3,5-epimerase